LAFAVSKEGGSFDALTGSTISSRAYANAVETAYAGYLWAKGELPSAEDALSGATKSNDEEPEAQKGDDINE
jgi:electron transport complex protein RnfG